jgi:hypothetical protein
VPHHPDGCRPDDGRIDEGPMLRSDDQQISRGFSSHPQNLIGRFPACFQLFHAATFARTLRQPRAEIRPRALPLRHVQHPQFCLQRTR